LTEAQARQRHGDGIPVGKFPWVANARAVMQNETSVEIVADGMAQHSTPSEAEKGASLVALGWAIDVRNRTPRLAARDAA